MKRVINRRIRRSGPSGQVVADVNAVIATGTGAGALSRQRIRIVQRNGKTEVDDVDIDTATPDPT